jgi:hypothetical protein
LHTFKGKTIGPFNFINLATTRVCNSKERNNETHLRKSSILLKKSVLRILGVEKLQFGSPPEFFTG